MAVLLGLMFLACVLTAIRCFDGSLIQEMYPWLISETEPGAEGAMYTLEEMQFKWALGGVLCLICGLFALVVGIFLGYQGWKRRRGW